MSADVAATGRFSCPRVHAGSILISADAAAAPRRFIERFVGEADQLFEVARSMAPKGKAPLHTAAELS
ncbi:hypothetical protein [Sphingopyxis sp. JAI108]|uniref:hypothetical protein n=1 Tax=Sphingopyxis sp. JAI108 TaxID=2723060 RepID=UPI0015CA1D67|nr:hypothetical protein [Sphingopyxis sp. JAI108]NYF32553.1 hypothetical protein [Sphingopyxis sp. JAI108]